MDMHELNCRVMVLQAIGTSVQTLLGPNKSLKCYISSDHDDNAMLGDVMQVLEALLCGENEGHPIGQLLYDCCREQQKSCGCGVTSLVCLCSYWASEILSLINKHCSTVFASLAVPLEKLRPTIPSSRTHSVSNQTSFTSTRANVSQTKPSISTSHRMSKALSMSRHFSGPASQTDGRQFAYAQRQQGEVTKKMEVIEHISCRLSHGKQLAMQLAVKAVQSLTFDGRPLFDDSLVFQHCIVGKDQNTSEIISGLIADVESDMTGILQQLVGRQLQILVIEGDCTPAWKHMGLQKVDHVTSHDPQQLYQSSNKVTWLKKCAEVLSNLQINLVAVGGMVSPLLWEHCLATGILVLSKLNRRQIDGICRLSKATPIAYITHGSSMRHIGSVELELLESGMSHRRSVRSGPTVNKYCFSCRIKSSSDHHLLVTAVLHSRTQTGVNTLQYQFKNCLQRLKHILNNAHQLIPGEGITEAHCIHSIQHIMKHQDSSSHDHWSYLPVVRGNWMSIADGFVSEWRDEVCESFKNGLKRFLLQVELNCRPEAGYFVAMTTVESKIEACRRQDVLSWKQPCVLDIERSKRESWKRAVQLLRIVFLSTKMTNCNQP